MTWWWQWALLAFDVTCWCLIVTTLIWPTRVLDVVEWTLTHCRRDRP